MEELSPCSKNCEVKFEKIYDNDNSWQYADVPCKGCGRTVAEIARWGSVGRYERLVILENAKKRKKEV